MKSIHTITVTGVLALLALSACTQSPSPQNDNYTAINALAVDESVAGSSVTIEGVVTYKAPQDTKQHGIYVQGFTTDMDDSDMTSEAVFVETSEFSEIKPGRHVRVTGELEKTDHGMSLTDAVINQKSDDDRWDDITPLELTLPLSADFSWQGKHHMFVTLPQQLTMSQSYYFGRYGHVGLSSQRLVISTEQFTAGSPEQIAIADQNKRDLLIMDDGSERQNPPVYLPYPQYSADNKLPSGTKMTGVSGVISTFKGQPILLPQLPVAWQVNSPDNHQLPARDKANDIRVATFNVLNYFTTLGERGASNEQELQRQTAKTVTAIQNSDADIIGLVEIENNGYQPSSALAALTHALNQNGVTDWRYVTPEVDKLGTASISVAFIYRDSRVKPNGAAITIDKKPFDAGTKRHRTPLVQSFESLHSGHSMTVVVNHFKSKGSRCGKPSDSKVQGNCNGDRTAAAKTLITELARLSAEGMIDERILVTGDLNAYSKEDPVLAFESAGYNNIVNTLNDDSQYSYVFRHQSGSLDHILVTKPVVESAVKGGRWHINADYSKSLDYNMEYKSAEQIDNYFNDSPYRSSDHDPVWVDIRL